MKSTIIDLNKINKMSGNIFIKKYKNKNLILKDNNIEIECKINKYELLFKNKNFYSLESIDAGNNINYPINIFSIYFYDIIEEVPSFQNVYINNIRYYLNR